MQANIHLDRKLHLVLFGSTLDLPPRYSKDWIATGRVIGKLSENIFFSELEIEQEEDCDEEGNAVFYWKAEFKFSSPKMDYSFKGQAATIPLAICLAALEYIELN